jgi:PPP family 3-phenylpropionic acid transporter
MTGMVSAGSASVPADSPWNLPPMSLPPLSPEQKIRPRRFELRMALIFFATLIPNGIHLPYFPLWLEANRFDPQQIAVILSAPMFLRVFTTPVITAFADAARDRANVLIALSAATTLCSAGYFLEPDYVLVLAVSLALTIVWTPQTPITDSLALSGVRRFGSSYTSMRIWGSISFLLANLAGGLLLARTGAGAVPAIIFATFAVALLAVLIAPRLGRPRVASPLSAVDIQEKGPKLLHPYFLFFAAGTGIIIGSHGFMYGFVSIYWKSVGIDDATVGILWCIGVGAEICMFMLFNRLFGSVSVVTVTLIASLAAIVRWLAYPLIWPLGLGIGGFVAVQCLHAFSTALVIIGLQKMIGESIAEERTGAAQGIAYFANGFCMAAVTLVSGPLYAQFGVDGIYFMVPVALAGMAMIALAARSAPKVALRRRHD